MKATAAPTVDNNGGGEKEDVLGAGALERALEDIDQKGSVTLGKKGKKGQCPTCDTQLFKVGLFGKKTPLNERGKVFQGICLKCFQQNIDLNEIAGLSEMPQSLTVPKVLSIPYGRRPSGGNATVVSGITLDVALMNDSLSGAGDLDAAADVERRSPVRKRDPVPKGSSTHANLPPLNDLTSSEDLWSHGGRIKGQRKSDPGLDIVLDLHETTEHTKKAPPVSEQNHGTPDNVDKKDTTDACGSGSANSPRRGLLDSGESSAEEEDGETTPQIEDIPKYVALVHMSQCEKKVRIAALKALSVSVWEHGAAAEVAFADAHGMIVLTKLMWDDMTDNVMQEAILGLLVSLVAPRNGKNIRKILVGEGIDGCVDALLITMHTLISNEALQINGCTVLCFLASACSIEPNVNDGTGSGAVLTVLSAMEAHQKSIGIQEWGVRTLYHQCTFSKNAEGNKRTVACGTLASGERGSHIILKAFHAAPSSPILADRLCKLYWCLSADEALAERLQPVADVFVSILTLIQKLMTDKDAASVIEAAIGAISNFTKTAANCRIINADKAIALALEVMSLHKESVGVLTEACCVIANLVDAAEDVDTAIEAEALDAIVDAMVLYSSDPFVVDEGVRALLNLAGRSEVARERLNSLPLCRKVFETLRLAVESAPLQVSTCRLISLICRGRNVSHEVLQEMLGSICRCMAEHLESERVQDAACSALRIISGQAGNRVTVKSSEVIPLIITAMEQYRSSKMIQLSACCTLWNVSAVPEGNEKFGDLCIPSIVEAMKSHLDTDAVLEMACSSLWTLIHGSENLKRKLVETEGSIEALTCVLVMHPSVPALLEKVVGVLSSLSSSQDLANKVTSTQTIDAVLDVVRNNGTAISLLHFCILFLKNSVVVSPHLSSSAKDAIKVVLTALKASQSNPDFQHGACVFLWVLAYSSPECKSQIVACDGMTILMIVLEGTQVQAVQDAALGALGALALERDER